MNHWVRWTAQNKIFPKSKYNFSEHLKKVGDFIETYPISSKDRLRFFIAARNWAYQHKRRVSCYSLKAEEDLWNCRVTLIALHNKRVYKDEW